jgi:hypothetical protein
MNPFEAFLWKWLAGVSTFCFMLALLAGAYWYRLRKQEPTIKE